MFRLNIRGMLYYLGPKTWTVIYQNQSLPIAQEQVHCAYNKFITAVLLEESMDITNVNFLQLIVFTKVIGAMQINQ